ncbi:hypothetical protein EZS27_015230 [termite gut metagenome]|uniref:CusB-like beta-barrel domain-containing protein n=1 Tax=termite gut metagenome TaxID=433724 RepID=A0A5J4RSS7_9ZZZZ
MKRIIIWVWLPVLCACGGSPGSGDASDKQYTVEGDRITVSEESPILQYIKTQRVQVADYRATFTASGVVQAIPSRYAEIIVADLDKVRVTAHVKEKDIDLIRNVADVEIKLIALPDMSIKGTINYVSGLLDEATRSVEIIIECDNLDHRMKPFMYGTQYGLSTPRLVQSLFPILLFCRVRTTATSWLMKERTGLEK